MIHAVTARALPLQPVVTANHDKNRQAAIVGTVDHRGRSQWHRTTPVEKATHMYPPIATRLALCALILLGSTVAAQEPTPDSVGPVGRQALEDAWWTGPILAAGATPLPKGHVLVEPYVYDVIRYGRYDEQGNQRDASRIDGYGSLTYALYGLTDNVTAGLIPTFGFNALSDGEDSSGIALGDLSLQAQYGLTRFRPGRRVPTTSLVVQQSLPTGKYDRLGDRPADGMGSGANTTTFGLYSQYFSWMPNGRILRTRLNLTYSVSDDPGVTDVSVYGTPQGFRGHASPGDSSSVTLSGEYSVTRNWVLALDLYYQHDDNTRISGYVASDDGEPVSFEQNSGTSWRFGLAPAVEYNFNGNVGLIVGFRWFATGRNTSASVTPVAAINMFY